ncbi:peptidoglycan D,D-transpeptidase FtsI family protein [Ancrocorticia populi]|uniref:peptidoglycan D,D-transpeptidase FtsI family protein n=1 Tax=Ancrocorticia populi TaxID=2175228 RepID=UPI0023573684|nr:penicillin-binding protein 2 [Ancrocorticia populi]MDN6486074.1 penicillin-binding protein 2 [Ancrocorticia sp.]
MADHQSLSARLKAPSTHSRRLRMLLTVFLVCSIVLGIRLVDLQGVRADDLSESAAEFRTRSYTLQAKRGSIVDSSGAVMATSVERYNVAVNQKLIGEYIKYEENESGEVVPVGTGAAAAAKELAPLLDMDEAELGGKLLGGDEKRTFVYLKKDISPELWREIRALRIPGIEPEQFMKREYPNGKVAGNVLGYTGLTGEATDDDTVETAQGQAGIERSLNDVLTGEDGELSVQIAGGAVLPNGDRSETPAVDGSDVMLTINRDLQDNLETAVDKTVEDQGAKWASAVVIEIGTGSVLALADSDTPDPSNLSDTDSSNWGSRAVSAPVEPGSTGKLMTFAAAVDQGKVEPLSTFTVSSTLTMPNGETIKDNETHATEDMTVAGILALSYNTGLIQIGDTISDDTRFDYMKKFGIGSKTGIELPAESAGILHDPSTWDNRTHYTTMFGQAWAATTLQLGQMVSVIGNGGVKAPVHIVDTVTDADGTEHPTVAEESEQVISPESADTMIEMMQAVTDSQSTGWRAKVPGYNIAGKTGTAQVPDENGNLTRRVGTFVGLVPAEDPQIAIAVAVYDASGAGYGGDVAAPVFKDVTTFAVRQLGIPPSTEPLVRLQWYPGEDVDND